MCRDSESEQKVSRAPPYIQNEIKILVHNLCVVWLRESNDAKYTNYTSRTID